MAGFSRYAAVLGIAMTIAAAPAVEACTRAVYLGPEDRVLTGRSMDWKLPMVRTCGHFRAGLSGTALLANVRPPGYHVTAVSPYRVTTSRRQTE